MAAQSGDARERSGWSIEQSKNVGSIARPPPANSGSYVSPARSDETTAPATRHAMPVRT
jgi:hypothetical protein